MPGQLERGPRPSPEVGWAWERLLATGGAVPIGRIAHEVGWSHKHLIARFSQQVGLRPKTAARLVRLNRVWQRLDERRPLDWPADGSRPSWVGQRARRRGRQRGGGRSGRRGRGTG
jgi:hypothetical protein